MTVNTNVDLIDRLNIKVEKLKKKNKKLKKKLRKEQLAHYKTAVRGY